VGYYRESALTPVLEWSAVTFLLIPLGQQFLSLLQRDLRFRALSVIQILRSVAYATVAITLAIYGFGVMSLVWGTLFAEALVAGALLIVAVNSNWLPHLHFRLADLRPFLSFGLFQMGERTLNYLGNNVDYLIIGRFLGAEPLGYYTLAYSIMRLPLLYVNPVVVTVAFPTFARVQDQDGRLRRGYAKILRYLSAANFPLMAGMFVVAPLFVTVIYGTRWLPAVPVIQIFAALGALKTLGNPLGSLLLAKGRADLGFYMNAVAVVGYAASNLLGIRYGITGVAFSSLVFSVLILFPIDFYFRWYLIRMPARDFFVAIRKAAVASGAVGIVVTACKLVLPDTNAVVTLITLAGIGATTYAAILWSFDRQFLIEAWGYMKPSPAKEHS